MPGVLKGEVTLHLLASWELVHFCVHKGVKQQERYSLRQAGLGSVAGLGGCIPWGGLWSMPGTAVAMGGAWA